MKMRDVFELPIDPEMVEPSDIYNYLKKDVSIDIADYHAAHAINMHDDLIDAVDVLLNHPEVADYGAICELLTRAKGEL